MDGVGRVDDLPLSGSRAAETLGGQAALVRAGPDEVGSAKKPLDDQLPVETINLLPRSLRYLVVSGAKTGREVADDLRLSHTDVEGLTGLPIGSLSRADEPLTLMSRRASLAVPFSAH